MNVRTTVDKLQTAVKFHRQGQLSQALRLYADVLSEDPRNADAWHLTGLVNFAREDLTESESQIRHAIGLRPEPDFHANLAAVLIAKKDSTAAEEACREVLRTQPSHHAALTHLGTSLRQQKRLGEAFETFQRAVTIRRDATSLCNLGTVLIDLGEFDDAREVLSEALSIDSTRPQILMNLAAVEREHNNEAHALDLLNRAMELGPNQSELHVNLGNVLLESHRLREAVEHYQEAIRKDPTTATAASRLGATLQLLGEWEPAFQCHQVACTLEPANHAFASSMLYSASLNPNLSADDVSHHHRQWGARLESRIAVEDCVCDFVADRVLRIGYVSPDIRSHATLRFLAPLLRCHNRDQFDIVVYSETGREDGSTDAVRELIDEWCWTRPLSDKQLAKKIREDRIDILVDLAGHTGENRLPVFARKPAPIQASFLGYPTTTGLSRVDYYLTDEIREPDGGAGRYTEETVMLPNGACCFEVTEASDPAEPPFDSNQHITFGSTHRIEKLSSHAMQVWAQAMKAVPDAQLLIIRDVFESESLRSDVAGRLEHAGVDRSRVRFEWSLPESHFDIYAKIDILLDVFPWGSGTTAYDAMWMGVPIPTIAGDRGGCRATASMMHFCGFPELVGQNVDEYIDIVAGLANDHERLRNLRRQIRPAMAATVCNGQQFARDIEAAYRDFWKRHLSRAVIPEENVA